MICHCLRFICPCLIWLKLKPGYTAPLPATALRDSMTSSQRCGSHYCPAEAPRHGKAWNNVDPKPRTWSWNLLSWFGICSFSHTLQDQVTKPAGCGMLVAHFPNHCLAHKSWPNTTCIVFCPRRLVIEFSFTPHPAVARLGTGLLGWLTSPIHPSWSLHLCKKGDDQVPGCGTCLRIPAGRLCQVGKTMGHWTFLYGVHAKLGIFV